VGRVDQLLARQIHLEGTADEADVLVVRIGEQATEEMGHVERCGVGLPAGGRREPLCGPQGGLPARSLMAQRDRLGALPQKIENSGSCLFVRLFGQSAQVVRVDPEKPRELIAVLREVVPQVVRPGLERA
jgi:hypothetical protein